MIQAILATVCDPLHQCIWSLCAQERHVPRCRWSLFEDIKLAFFLKEQGYDPADFDTQQVDWPWDDIMANHGPEALRQVLLPNGEA